MTTPDFTSQLIARRAPCSPTFLKSAVLRSVLVGSLFLACSSSNVHADVKFATETGFSITNVSESSAPIEAVYSHFVQHIDMWWPKDHTWWKGTLSIDERAGGCFCETKDNASAQHMQVSYIEPNKKVVLTGGLGPLQEMGMFGALTWQFDEQENGEGTKVTLTYTASGHIHFNGKPASLDEAKGLVKVVDQVQAQQLSALTSFSDKN